MKKQLIFLCLISLFGLMSCLTNNKRNKSSEKINLTQIDTSIIAILPYKAISFRKFEDCKAAELTMTDMGNIDALLRKCVDDYNPKAEKEYNDLKNKNPNFGYDIQHFILDMKRYKRQYVAVTNNKGEKEVWVNCFCKAMYRDWKQQLIFVRDGGNCYFNLKINLTQNRYYDLYVNGVS